MQYSTPQLPVETAQIPSNRGQESFNRGTSEKVWEYSPAKESPPTATEKPVETFSWVAVKGLTLNYQNPETILFGVYPYKFW